MLENQNKNFIEMLWIQNFFVNLQMMLMSIHECTLLDKHVPIVFKETTVKSRSVWCNEARLNAEHRHHSSEKQWCKTGLEIYGQMSKVFRNCSSNILENPGSIRLSGTRLCDVTMSYVCMSCSVCRLGYLRPPSNHGIYAVFQINCIILANTLPLLHHCN